jgi:Xaa-Pro aminopeptidase
MKRAVLAMVAGVALAAGAHAQYTDPAVIADYGGAKTFAARREALAKECKSGIVILFARDEEPEAAHYREDNDFFYFTGVADLGAVMVMDCAQGQAAGGGTILFEPQQEPRTAQVYGANMLSLPKEKQAVLGFPAVLPTKQLDTVLTALMMQGSGKTFWLRLDYPDKADLARVENAIHKAQQYPESYHAELTPDYERIELLRKRYPQAEVKDITPSIDTLRNIKDAEEIAILRRVGKMSADGLQYAIERARPGEYQYQIEGDATWYFYDHGAQQVSYPAIVGSGADINTWHYFSNRHQVQPNELVVFDYAASLDQMTMDITRTFNVSGPFTAEQAKWYAVDLAAQEAVIAMLTPGHTYEEASDAGKAVFEKAGIGDQWRGYPGHFVGLATHDVPGPARGPIKAGQVVTSEPIVEFPDKQMHYRVEDTVLVTSGQPEILSASIPKEMHAVEKMVGAKKPTADTH